MSFNCRIGPFSFVVETEGADTIMKLAEKVYRRDDSGGVTDGPTKKIRLLAGKVDSAELSAEDALVQATAIAKDAGVALAA